MPPAPTPSRVLILERNCLVGEMMRQSAHAALPASEVRALRCVDDAELILSGQTVDFLVVGTDGHDEDIFEVLRNWLSHPRRASHVLLVTSRRDSRSLGLFNSLPLDGVLDPSVDGTEELTRTISIIAAGGKRWTDETARCMLEHFLQRDSVARSLTPTQLMVLAFVGIGYSDSLIATQLQVSRGTVESMRRDLRAILGVERQSDLVLLALRQGIARVTPERVETPGLCTLLSARALRSKPRTMLSERRAVQNSTN
jgi:DNA-binding NarL/FixJ family response regulator